MFLHKSMRLYQLHVCTKLQGNRTINTLTVALKPPKMAQNNSYVVITSWRRCVIKISTPSLHPPYPPLYPVQVSWRSVEASRSLNVCKKVVVVVAGGHQMACPETAIFGLFWRSGEGGLSRPEIFFGWILLLWSQPPHKNIKSLINTFVWI